MGDPRRFKVFADYIASLIPESDRSAIKIADVAAGCGALSFELKERGFKYVIPYEVHPRAGGQVVRLGMRVQEFKSQDADGFDLIVGMHPDAATTYILDGAIKFNRRAIVVPCCARDGAWTYWGPRLNVRKWTDFLINESMQRGATVSKSSLKMSGSAATISVNM